MGGRAPLQEVVQEPASLLVPSLSAVSGICMAEDGKWGESEGTHLPLKGTVGELIPRCPKSGPVVTVCSGGGWGR